jgi:hypothetical protein
MTILEKEPSGRRALLVRGDDMRRTILSLCSLAMLCLGVEAARGQETKGAPASDPAAGLPAVSDPLALTAGTKPQDGLSSYIIGTNPDCCGPLSDRMPMQTEFYVRSGASLRFGDGALKESITNGWNIEGGFRGLFFNAPGDAAWTIDMHLLNIHNTSTNNAPLLTLYNVKEQDQAVPMELARASELNRTFVGLGGGREWYLYGSAKNTRTNDGARWRIGLDGGGRWGTEKVQFREIIHETDTIGAVYAAFHSDVDFPCGCVTFFAGMRVEWDYTWSDILQIQNKSDLQDINLMLSFGLRY